MIFKSKINIALEVIKLLKTNGILNVEGICIRSGYSPAYIESIMRVLKRYDLVISKRGPKGGYSLAKFDYQDDNYKYRHICLHMFYKMFYKDTDNKIINDGMLMVELHEVIS